MDMQTALATTKALVKRYPLLENENLVLGAPWAKTILPYGFFSVWKDYRKSANSRRRAEISTPNCQLRGGTRYHHS